MGERGERDGDRDRDRQRQTETETDRDRQTDREKWEIREKGQAKRLLFMVILFEMGCLDSTPVSRGQGGPISLGMWWQLNGCTYSVST